ncbi:MAG TPA: YceI family protein [candidate division Zixibacteria bacterium]|nr:YceI family protein [candidate division Zixibacteria bacterium]MDD4918931.1 YceI family protein [candidate division Zixibacteria bacterium]MDM7972278.1 YceI family protein [candidate division Zixibacteria bacterium]HPC11657.1 YceI family protein [candidate division Zixibacteria bacterium]HPM35924.1 YceI family protein [candidate division Zixibacteria bacterium]
MLKKAALASSVVLAAGAGVSAAQWEIDRAHSSIGFSVRHMVVSKVPGKFTDFDGNLEMAQAADGKLDLASAKVSMTAKAASINTDNDKRDEHLRSADFFDAATYPELTFVSKKVIPGEGDKFKLIGDLTIRGVTKEVTFDGTLNGVVTDFMGNTRAGFSAAATINRQDFGVSWSKLLDNGGLVAGDNVDIIIEIEAVLPKPESKG